MRFGKIHDKYSLSPGFTLVEMAVVMSIVGLVMLTVFPALTAVRSANQVATTQSNLRSLMLATAAYVQANGCLPCPAVPGGTGTNFGRVPTASACGACSAPQGIPPFVALGLPAATSRDGWGNWITMRVDPGLTNPTPIVVPPTTSSAEGFCHAGDAASGASAPTVTTPGGSPQKVAVVFVSHGSSGYGSYLATPQKEGYLSPFSSRYPACADGGYAQCNAATNNTGRFYDAPIVISDTKAYDDVLAYATRNVLVAMLGTGACSTNW